MSTHLHLILGGARSGKSRFAERRAQVLEAEEQRSVVYIATAQALDEEMQQRIAHHQQTRPVHWHTVEESLALAAAIEQAASTYPQAVILVDCLTLWLTNALLDSKERWKLERQALLAQVKQLQQPLILVSNEVGSGIVPLGELSREFVDESGRLHQALATLAQQVTLVVAGLPLVLKNE